jgi:arginine deiminase
MTDPMDTRYPAPDPAPGRDPGIPATDLPVDLAGTAAYGGPGWVHRAPAHRDELGTLWAPCGVASEFGPLRSVLLHRPGPEVDDLADPDDALMLEPLDPDRLRAQHDGVAAAYRAQGVEVHYVDPPGSRPGIPPNLLFCADVFFMTPEGAVVGRPASAVRAGEERWVARALAELGIPVLRTVAGEATFEGADALWLDGNTVMVGRGLRTNDEGVAQVEATLAEQGVATLVVDLPMGSMHLMGEIRIVDHDLAFVRRGLCPWRAVQALEAAGYDVHAFPSEAEVASGMAHNFVVLGPRRILMPAGNPESRAAYEALGVTCHDVPVDQVARAAGAIGCLTGVLERSQG